jgi:sensor histidine kinase YesM
VNLLRQLYARYRRWEDGYVVMLDTLDAGRPVDPSWSSTLYRRRMLRRCAQLSPTERAELREFIWRYRGWRGWVWFSGIFAANCLIGWLIHLVAPKFGPIEAMVFANLMVFGCGFGLAAAWFSASRFKKIRLRSLFAILVMTIVGALAGSAIAALAKGESPLELIRRTGFTVALAGVMVGGIYGGGMALLAGLRNRELKALNAKLAAEAERERLGTQLAESRLRLLRAQVEPHFLFNTLGAVQQLAERGAPEAAALTGHLIHFLRSSLGSFRAEPTTLDAELQLVESYLQIMQLRLGYRLAFTIDVPADLRRMAMQPTLLITLVENAIKHGIEPHPAGGAIAITARRDHGALVIEVADTGAGMSELPGAGEGLGNVREQLRLAHGDRAGLELFDNTPQGVVARLSLPLEP